MAAIGAKMDPRAEQRAAVYQNKQKGKALASKADGIKTHAADIEKEGLDTVRASASMPKGRLKKAFKEFGESQVIESEKELEELHGSLLDEQVSTAKELFDLDPSEKNYEDYRALKLEQDFYATPEEEGGGKVDPIAAATKKARKALRDETSRIRKSKKGGSV